MNGFEFEQRGEFPNMFIEDRTIEGNIRDFSFSIQQVGIDLFLSKSNNDLTSTTHTHTHKGREQIVMRQRGVPRMILGTTSPSSAPEIHGYVPWKVGPGQAPKRIAPFLQFFFAVTRKKKTHSSTKKEYSGE